MRIKTTRKKFPRRRKRRKVLYVSKSFKYTYVSLEFNQFITVQSHKRIQNIDPPPIQKKKNYAFPENEAKI